MHQLSLNDDGGGGGGDDDDDDNNNTRNKYYWILGLFVPLSLRCVRQHRIRTSISEYAIVSNILTNLNFTSNCQMTEPEKSKTDAVHFPGDSNNSMQTLFNLPSTVF